LNVDNDISPRGSCKTPRFRFVNQSLFIAQEKNNERLRPLHCRRFFAAANSGNSGERSRDKKMNKDVLDVEHFSEITFVPNKFDGTIAPTGDSNIQVSGIFTLHGTPHNHRVPMLIHIEGGTLTAKTHFVVPYVNWGLKDPSIFVLKVAKEVEIDLTLLGRLSPLN